MNSFLKCHGEKISIESNSLDRPIVPKFLSLGFKVFFTAAAGLKITFSKRFIQYLFLTKFIPNVLAICLAKYNILQLKCRFYFSEHNKKDSSERVHNPQRECMCICIHFLCSYFTNS